MRITMEWPVSACSKLIGTRRIFYKWPIEGPIASVGRTKCSGPPIINAAEPKERMPKTHILNAARCKTLSFGSRGHVQCRPGAGRAEGSGECWRDSPWRRRATRAGTAWAMPKSSGRHNLLRHAGLSNRHTGRIASLLWAMMSPVTMRAAPQIQGAYGPPLRADGRFRGS